MTYYAIQDHPPAVMLRFDCECDRDFYVHTRPHVRRAADKPDDSSGFRAARVKVTDFPSAWRACEMRPLDY